MKTIENINKDMKPTQSIDNKGLQDPRDTLQVNEGLSPDFAKMNVDGGLSPTERGPQAPGVEDPSSPTSPERDPDTSIETPMNDPSPQSPPLDAPTNSDVERQGEVRVD